jgi:hypothetical protein
MLLIGVQVSLISGHRGSSSINIVPAMLLVGFLAIMTFDYLYRRTEKKFILDFLKEVLEATEVSISSP